jgi:hypothetical protein
LAGRRARRRRGYGHRGKPAHELETELGREEGEAHAHRELEEGVGEAWGGRRRPNRPEGAAGAEGEDELGAEATARLDSS